MKKKLTILAEAVLANILAHYICLIANVGFTYLLQII